MAAKSDSSQNVFSSLAQIVNNMVDLHDPTAAGHQSEVALLAHAIAEEMKLDQDVVDCVSLAGQIHDIGKIEIRPEILANPGKLNHSDQMAVMRHPWVSYEILKPIHFPWPVADVVFQHHERLDGSGYPNGLTGDQVRLESKILAVADVVQAMFAGRSYHPPFGMDNVIQELEEHKGIFYDAAVVDSYRRLVTRKDKGITRQRNTRTNN